LVILERPIVGLSESALDRFVAVARRAAGLKGTVNILVTNNATLRSLNREFRGKNEATDVLSFPAPLSELTDPRNRRFRLAGEIAISADIAVQNALRLGHVAAQEVKVLALHGILHLVGFDHERDNGEMARKESNLREKLGLPSALIERAEPPSRNASQRRTSRAGARRQA
jgi:probable rRNA maturation factor